MQDELLWYGWNENEEREFARDWQRMKEYYPKRARPYWRMVEDICDRMEYEGSPMYAELPDREQMHRFVEEMQGRMQQDTQRSESEQEEERDWLLSMLCHEMFVRRMRKNQYCKRFTN